MEQWLQAITTVGFPIVLCLALLWYFMQTVDKHREEIRDLNEQHKKEMESTTVALTNNTLALQRLVGVIEGKGVTNE